MFSLRPYRSLKEEEETPYGKAVIFNCRGDIPARSSHSSNLLVCSVDQEEPSLISCSQTSSASSSIANRGVSVSPSSSYSTTITTSTSSSKSATSTSSSSPASFTLHSIKAAWKSLSSLSFSGSRLPHLERAESYPDQTNSHDYRYTHFPTSIVTSSSSAVPSASSVAKRNQNHKESPFSQTHLHISPASRSYGFPLRASSSHSSPSSTSALNLAHCLRRRRSKSKSDNALQKIGVGIKAHSDQNLHRVCLIGGAGSIPPSSNAIFSNVHLSGGSGDSGGSCSSGTNRYRGSVPQRSRSLERNHRTRIHSQEPPHHTRSLERNHKFRVNLRGSPFASSPARDDPPDHPAPPPPTPSLGYLRRPPLPSSSRIEVVDGSGGSVSSNSSGSSSSGGNSTMEGGQAGSFINKPPRGWLHPDQQLAQDGICYGVRYIGALEVNTSMKSLNFDTRSLIAKECISKVCEAAGLKTADRKRKVIKSISRILGDQPMMEHAGSNVTLTITSASLTLTTLECGTIVASHDMPNISFASGGDPDTLDFIAYVAKDTRFGRACFVLECGGGLAQDVITTIGQAFELRFKEYLKRTPASVQYTNVKPDSGMLLNGEEGMSWNNKNDLEYYNDLPGKVPPDLPPPVPPLPQYTGVKSAVTNAVPIKSPVSPTDPSGSAHSKKTESVISTSPLHVNSLSNLNNRGNDNLIDFTNEGTTNLVQKAEPEYVNDSVIKQRQIAKDPFDMQPFSMQLTQLGGGGMASSKNIFGGGVPPPHVMKPLPLNQRLELQREVWFHGPISRREAEALLKQDGDFLVRESQGTAGQYVLTGIQNNIKKHLLLVDPEGVVRTKSRTFDSVSHLINYHKENELPIVSAESALVLRNPVMRPH